MVVKMNEVGHGFIIQILGTRREVVEEFSCIAFKYVVYRIEAILPFVHFTIEGN